MTAQSLQPCDLVMKGGITSGVVYPPAIYEISRHYRFRRIGGASAGAIAAAGAAAAEYGRVESTTTDVTADASGIIAEQNGKKGFEQLKKIKCYLSKDGNLRNLFQPSPDTKPLMNLVDAWFPSTPPKQANSKQQAVRKPGAFQPLLRALQSLIHMLQFAVRLISIWATNYPCFSWSVVGCIIIGVVLAALFSLAVFGVASLLAPTDVAYNASILKLSLCICGIIGAWFGLHIGGVVGAIVKLPQDFYGICTGHTETIPTEPLYKRVWQRIRGILQIPSKKAPALTDWLSDKLNEMAGLKKNEPLTFGHLKSKMLQNGQDVSITLRMITSNLSQGQPYLLPTGLKNFLFKEDEMRQLFPNNIVEHMVKYAACIQNPVIPIPKLPKLPEGKRYHYLPDEEYLPVVVAMRMSLSFPILLSAIPLYTIRASAKDANEATQRQLQEKTDLQKNWFSDGGICNNFPIEFFDAWLPRWPTFGINLTSLPAEAVEDRKQGTVRPAASPASASKKLLKKEFFSALDPNDERRASSVAFEDVYLPKANDVQDPAWQDLQGIAAFVWAMISTGVFYRETVQANLPSYRERVAQIRLSDDEGGLNLNMTPDTIGKIVEKGEKAGRLFWNPGPQMDPDKFNLTYHQWVRFRILMAKLEENFERMGINLNDPALENLLTKSFASYSDYPYPPPDKCWYEEANIRFQALQCLLQYWRYRGTYLFGDGAPQPDTVLRVTPEI